MIAWSNRALVSGAGLCLLGLVAIAPNVSALLSPMDFETCVKTAGVAFAGTVTSMRAERFEGAMVTRVTFSDVVYGKGSRSGKSLVLTMCGGEVDGQTEGCEDVPVFQLHQRYVLLVKADLGSHRNAYSPIVGTNQGLFLLEAEKPGGHPVVPGVIGYRSGHLLMKDRGRLTPPYPLYARPGVIAAEFVPDPGTRLNEKQFLALIRKVDKEP
jgi:hypothetical protein